MLWDLTSSHDSRRLLVMKQIKALQPQIQVIGKVREKISLQMFTRNQFVSISKKKLSLPITLFQL